MLDKISHTPMRDVRGREEREEKKKVE